MHRNRVYNKVEKYLSLQQAVKEKYPKVNIEYTYLNMTEMEKKIAVMSAANDSPDIMYTQEITNLVAMKALEPLDAYLEKDRIINKEKINKDVLDYTVVDGKLYSLPIIARAYALGVNKAKLAQVGLNPEDIKTWGDLKNAAKLLTKDGKYGYAVSQGSARFAFREGLFGGVSNGFLPNDTSDGAKKKYIEMLNFYKEMAPYMPPAQVTWAYADMFKAYCKGAIPYRTFNGCSKINGSEQYDGIVNKYAIQMPKLLGQSEMEVAFQGAFVKLTTDMETPENTYNFLKSEMEKINTKYKK